MPEFEGRILMVEDYDLRLARRLVSGVDVWLNNPVYPLEASGTSGMKAGINGVLNLSVLDGWWDEGYDGQNGWAIKPVGENIDDARRDREEARDAVRAAAGSDLPALLQARRHGLLAAVGEDGQALDRHPAAALQFHAHGERVPRQVLPARHRARAGATRRAASRTPRKLAAWKAHVRRKLGQRAPAPARLTQEEYRLRRERALEIGVYLNGLKPEDVVVELLHRPSDRTGKSCATTVAIASNGKA